MAEEVCIELLGDFRVRLPGGGAVALGPQKAASLLAFLAYHLDRSHAREELVDLFWPEATRDGGRSSLRSALSALRRELETVGGADFLVADRQYVGLDREHVTTDVRRYEAAARRARQSADPAGRVAGLEEAVALYRGPFLSGFYDDWAVVAREHFQQQHVRALRDLSAALAAAGDTDRARDYALRVLEIEPLDEESHAGVMRLLAAEGEASALTRQFREMERRLQDELGAAPSTGIRALYARLLEDVRARTAAPSAPTPRAVTPAPTPPGAPAPAQEPLAAVPPALNRFFGREAELERLLALLGGATVTGGARPARLVTLTGPGGCGKTRLAAEVGHRLSEAGVPVGYVPLADVTRADLFPAALLQAVGVAPGSGADLGDLVRRRLSSFNGVLILDNFEQIAEDGAAFVHTLLEAAPGLRLLVTSRQVLGLGGEQEMPVPPLPVPQLPGVGESPDDAPASVQLFLDRARAVRSDFSLTRENAAVVAAICERLDGIPLALELAAAWVGTLAPAQLLARLDDRFRLLTSRRKDLPERHRTLRSAIESSFQELEPDVRAFFARLSVFRDGATLAAVEAVCGEARALEFVSLLRDRSLLVATPRASEMRFRLLETLRDYGRGQLSSDERSDLERRHALYFRDFAAEQRPLLSTPAQGDALDRLDADVHNLRAALEWAVAAPDEEAAETACTIALSLFRFWTIRGHTEEARRWFGEVVARGPEGVPPKAYGEAVYFSGSFALINQEFDEAERLFRRALDLLGACGDDYGVVNSICRLGLVQFGRRDFAGAERTFRDGLTRARMGGYLSSEAHLLKCLGVTLRDLGRTAEARRVLDDGLSLSRLHGDPHGITMLLAECAHVALLEGDLGRAEGFLHEHLPLTRTLKAISHEARALSLRARIALRRGLFAEAAADCDESLRLWRTCGDRAEVARTLALLVLVRLHEDASEPARKALQEAARQLRQSGDAGGLRALLPLVGALAAAEGHAVAAAQVWGAADASLTDAPAGDAEGTDFLSAARQRVRETLGDARFAAEIEAGRRTPPAELDRRLLFPAS